MFHENQQLLIQYLQTKEIRIRNKIVENNMGLVYNAAYKFSRSCSVPVDDLIQIGALGLIQAIERYNPTKSSKLSSFAIFFINGAILMYLRDKDKIIKIPRKIQELYQKIKRNAKKKGISYQESVKELGINLEEAKEAIIAHESTFVELPEINYYDTNYNELDILLSKLPSKYAEIIKLIYLEEYTITQIKNMLNLSFYQIKQLEEEGMNLLKNIASNIIYCPKCFTNKIVKNGKRTKKQQYLCKECGYQFIKNAAPAGRPGHDDTIKIAVLTAIQNGKSFAWCETYLNICKSTAYAWTQQYMILDNKLVKKSMIKD